MVPSGPGWWQASDGRWYPPELHPWNQATPVSPVPGPPPPSGRSTGVRLLVGLATLVVVAIIGGVAAVVVSGTSGSGSIARRGDVGRADTTLPESMLPDAPDVSGSVEIVGSPGGPLGELLAAAVTDIEDFWADELPRAYGVDYEPVAGRLYSASPDEPLPPCAESAEQVADNAFYCSAADVVAWDDTGLIPRLLDEHGTLAVAVVLAHEWGHAIQARVGMEGATVTLEHQADCFAGAWVAHVRAGDSEFFTADGEALDRALAGFIEIADTPGTAAEDPSAHGSAFDRINGFQDGLENGAAACAEYRDDNIALVEFPFTEFDDFSRGGNLPYDEILAPTVADLEDYWRVVASEVFGATWTPLADPVPFDPDRGTPSCDGDETEGFVLFYCVPDRFIAFDDVGLFPRVYVVGDFAVQTLFATQYGLAAQDELGIAPDGVAEQNLLADCLAGSWTASVFLGDRPDTGALTLSPGDLDEAVAVLLAFGDRSGESGQGSGFDRVNSYRKGVLGGVEACTGGG